MEIVSIVVPAYNAEETILETLESLRAQTYRDLEVIIVDDGSKDQTGAIAAQFAEANSARFRYLRQLNAGQAAALNSGWTTSKGRYLGYLSADDLMYPSAVEDLVRALEKGGEVCLYPDYDLIDLKSRPLRKVEAPEFSAQALIEESVCQPGPGALFRREAFEKAGGWNPKLRLTPDFDFWLRVSQVGRMARYPHVVAGFRVHEGSQSFAAPSPEKSEEAHQVIDAFFKAYPSCGFSRDRALSWAHTLSARLHFRAGRWTQAFSHLMIAVRFNAGIVSVKRFWHLLGSGLFGRLRYRLTAVVARE